MFLNALFRKIILFIILGSVYCTAENKLAADYAYLLLMTTTPYFATADYTIENEDGVDIDISITRFPLAINLLQTENSFLQLELEYALQTTNTIYPNPFFPNPGEYIDSEWDSYGFGLGLLYNYKIAKNLLLRPNIRYAFGGLKNDASYHGPQTIQIADQLDEAHLFNWETNASIINIGVGWTYFYKMLDRISNVRIDVNHVYVDSFNEDHEDLKFSEQANMAALRSDMIFPTGMKIFGEDLNFVVLLGTNYFFGENRNTLGYNTSYQAGFTIPIPIKWNQKKLFDLNLGYQYLWAEKMSGSAILYGFDLNF
jgi:hypothetical protein